MPVAVQLLCRNIVKRNQVKEFTTGANDSAHADQSHYLREIESRYCRKGQSNLFLVDHRQQVLSFITSSLSLGPHIQQIIEEALCVFLRINTAFLTYFINGSFANKDESISFLKALVFNFCKEPDSWTARYPPVNMLVLNGISRLICFSGSSSH
jgi:hypothetical protein